MDSVARMGTFAKFVILATLVAAGIAIGLGVQTHREQAHSTHSLDDGVVTIAKLSPSLRNQLQAVVQIAGALPASDSDASCADGQVLSFSNGKIICVTLRTAGSGQIAVTEVGPPGPQGDAGANGLSGASGSNGVNGLNGADGLAGATGATGIQGPQGLKGDKGDAGTTGAQGSAGVLSTSLGNGLSGSLASQILSLNLVTDPNGGLALDGSGLTLLASCNANQLLKWNGSSWACANDDVSTVTSADLVSTTPGITITGGAGSVLGDGTSIDIATATASQSGLLDATDWNTFNNKQNALTFQGQGLFYLEDDTLTATTCASNQVMLYNGSSWICGSPGTTFTAGAGLGLSGSVLSLNPGTLGAVSSVAGSDELLLYNGTSTETISYNDLFGGLLGSLNYQGTWNASTNSPDLGAICTSDTKGYYYVVGTAGTTDLDGISSWNANDWAVCNGTDWQQVQTTNDVTSVFGRTGTIAAANGDYDAAQITNTPTGDITGTNVQDALNELDTNKLDANLADGLLFVGNDGMANGVALSGDASLSDTGVLTLSSGAITNAKIASGAITFGDIASNSCSSGQVIEYNGSAWTCGTDSGANLSVGTIDSQTKNGNGAVISGNTLYLQSADASNPGLVTTGSQTFGGSKTFADGITVDSSSTNGSVLSIGAGGSSSVLPLSITSAGSQLASYTNSSGTTGSYQGSGSPEGNITANIGSTYMDVSSGTFYTKTSGSGNTGWTVVGSDSGSVTTPQAGTVTQSSNYSATSSYNSTGLSMTLPAAGTYQITAQVSGEAVGTGDDGALMKAEFYDSTDGTIVGTPWTITGRDAPNSTDTTSGFGTGIGVTTITVTRATTIVLEAATSGSGALTTATVLGPGTSAAGGGTTMSYIPIATTATGVSMNALTAALGNGSLNNGDYSQTWNWDSLTGANDGLVLSSTSATEAGYSLASFGESNLSAAGNTLQLSNSGSGLALLISSGGLAIGAGSDYTATGTQNNVSLGNYSNIRLNPDSALTITGIDGGSNGRLLFLSNVSDSVVTLANQNSSSSAANQIVSPSGSDISLAPNNNALLLYDSTSSVWRVISTSVVSAGTPEFVFYNHQAQSGSVTTLSLPTNATAVKVVFNSVNAAANAQLHFLGLDSSGSTVGYATSTYENYTLSYGSNMTASSSQAIGWFLCYPSALAASPGNGQLTLTNITGVNTDEVGVSSTMFCGANSGTGNQYSQTSSGTFTMPSGGFSGLQLDSNGSGQSISWDADVYVKY